MFRALPCWATGLGGEHRVQQVQLLVQNCRLPRAGVQVPRSRGQQDFLPGNAHASLPLSSLLPSHICHGDKASRCVDGAVMAFHSLHKRPKTQIPIAIKWKGDRFSSKNRT